MITISECEKSLFSMFITSLFRKNIVSSSNPTSSLFSIAMDSAESSISTPTTFAAARRTQPNPRIPQPQPKSKTVLPAIPSV